MWISLVDFVSAAILITVVFLKFKARWTWALYSVACFSYSALSFFTGLYGLAVVNLLIGGIAIRNWYSWKGREHV